jgi:hypothetical protein
MTKNKKRMTTREWENIVRKANLKAKPSNLGYDLYYDIQEPVPAMEILIENAKKFKEIHGKF